MNDNITYIIYLKVVSQTFYPVFCISTCKLSDLGILSNLIGLLLFSNYDVLFTAIDSKCKAKQNCHCELRFLLQSFRVGSWHCECMK